MKFFVSLTADLPILIDLLPKILGIKLRFYPKEKFISSARTFLVIVSLSFVSGKLAFLHDDYLVVIENCAHIVV